MLAGKGCVRTQEAMLSSVSPMTFVDLLCEGHAKIAVLLGLLNGKKHKNFWECSGENLDQF